MTSAPVPARRPTERRQHGDVFMDPYEWLRDKGSKEVLDHLRAENEHTEVMTAHLSGLQQELFEEIRSRTKETNMSVPVRSGDWWYYSRIEKGSQYSILGRLPASGPDDWDPPQVDGSAPVGEQILLDANTEAADHEFFSLGAFSVSDDHEFLAWSCDVTGNERYELRVRQLSSGQDLPERIDDIAAGAVWSADGRHIFYTRVDEAWRPHQVWRHEFGAKAPDVLVFEEPDERFFVSVGRTTSEQYLVIAVGSKVTSEYRVLSANDPTGDFRVVLPRSEGVLHSIEHAVVEGRELLFLLHNRDHPNFTLVVTPWSDPTAETVLLDGEDGVRLEDIQANRAHILVQYRKGGLPTAGTMSLSGSAVGPLVPIDLGEDLVGLGATVTDFHSPWIRLGVGSFTRPARLFELDPVSSETVLRKEAEVLGGHDPDAYLAERIWATSHDGEQVPVSVVRCKDTPLDGSAPLWLYGYGSYETSLDPSFAIPRLSLLDRGFIAAFVHVRGGGELGRRWYEDGKFLDKPNSFHDFVAVGRLLVELGYTKPERIVAEGGSAGGLLVGAALNLAPDLFAGVVADVPFVDPLTSILDPSLPLTVIEWDEWGNSLADADVYACMRGYSPYENVKTEDYPSVLALTSLNDTRVLYVEPAKWVAELRHTTTGDAPILLKTNMAAGHGGSSGRYESWKERAFELAWIIDVATGGPLAPKKWLKME